MKETSNDAPIEEVRALRCQISEHFEHDPAQLVAHYMQLQEQYRDRLIESARATDPKNQSAA